MKGVTSDILPIWADFNKIGRSLEGTQTYILLTAAGTLAALARRGIRLREGMVLHLYDEDLDEQGRPEFLLAEGVARYDERRRQWLAVVRSDQIRRRSESV